MKIFVAGATGAIGRPLIRQLRELGHDIVALTRSPQRARMLAQQGVEPAIADVFDADAVKGAIAHAQPEVVIEQLTALPKTYTPESMQTAAEQTNTISRLVKINGQPGIIQSVNGKIHSAIAFEIVNGYIQSIYSMRNPDKLKQICKSK